MKLLRRGMMVLLLLPVLLTMRASAAAADNGPAAVVQALYQEAMANTDGFSPKSVHAVKVWVAPELYARLRKKANEPTPKGDAPDIDGDVFLDAQDLPTRFEVGSAAIDGGKAKVAVTLTWSAETRHYTVLLEQIGGAWKVTNIDFGKDGKLTDLL
jgi:Protein of unknown function (DUF3828)